MICKGTRVIFEMAEGPDVRPPAGNGMLHGKDWPHRSILVGPFRRGDQIDDAEVPADARKYLGRNHVVRRGAVDLSGLPRALGEWEKLGVVEQLFYWRGGTRAPGGMRHRFNKLSTARILLGHGKAMLYRRGQWYRLELPRGAIVDDRGIVWP